MHSTLTCAGCSVHVPPPGQKAYPFRCAAARPDDDIDHVVRRVLDPVGLAFPAPSSSPFLAWRSLFHSHALALRAGLSDDDYVDLACRLDEALLAVEGRGFRQTPCVRAEGLSGRLGFAAEGGIWIKDETGNVAGSHKGRHLMGIMLHLQVIDALGLAPHPRPSLAIASCGNAALAAAVVARAAGWPLDVFVPAAASPAVLVRLRDLGARVNICERRPGIAGDPCYLAFRDAVAAGALPFCCQGSENGLTIEGGETLAWEIVAALGDTPLDAIFVQVGGGALASAVVQAFEEAASLNAAHVPRIYTVQTQGAHPLERAYRLVLERISAHLAGPGSPPAVAAHRALVRAEMRFARTHRRRFMWPWEQEPRSVAHGILDDETYDWAAVVEGMLSSGGVPLVVDDKRLIQANMLAREITAINVDHTGSAGLAGLLEQLEAEPHLRRERVGVIFTGVQR